MGIASQDNCVTKVQDKTSARKELRMLKKMQRNKIDPEELYFCHVVHGQVFNLASSDTTVSELQTISPKLSHSDLAITFTYGGTHLLAFLELIGDTTVSGYRGPLKLVQFVHSFSNLCSGLAWIHSKNIYHFDIKPGNIVAAWSSSSEIPSFRLVDFGLSSGISELQKVKRENQQLYSASYVYWPLEMAAFGKASAGVLSTKMSLFQNNIVKEISTSSDGKLIDKNHFTLSSQYITWINEQMNTPDPALIAPRCDTYGLLVTIILCMWRLSHVLRNNSGEIDIPFVTEILYRDIIPELSLSSSGGARKDASTLASFFKAYGTSE
jgi:hypothetical protein